MVLHPANTKSMLLATRQKHPLRPLHLNLKNSHIEQVYEHRHIGVIIDDEFSWRPHITGTCKIVSNKSVSVVTAQTLSASCFTNAHISLHLTYASIVL